ncbi:Fic family protein [Pseudosulfitobacter pseudonitzschiae]|uniref:Fic family protein n=1 Tax=Pseudosulfitobacter pseudonitzschiae TaxID=1402135 RepID=UPI001AFC8367|nr:Fic family protein [Pseudosulfitobacter pseudonitzschiae]MBM1817586.1 Fic family protein [Pseudosulfitobacter pseudonitzschiae]MBM1834497.1 Fic family protein [Pseudosulfitobacter pseudonitzschiae]MBM1839362.1 Fic family protein [Pseudosulfitobacter pseudonitzschiae]MBM1844212.1 Fic family protein [Pseudosulfitobacter pseudonitzschiae]MBM1849047.1 Fic family protein [Pseudosulfitobacter pseudonitzschiae]
MLETPGRIEPCFFEDHIPAALADLSVEIQRAASGLGHGLHPDSAAELADLVRMMNCYYSNLIEGHNTRPRDIARALAGAELEAETRPLALEARAHVIVQRAIDQMHRDGTMPTPTSVEFLTWVHRAFYDEMPDEFRVVDHPDGTQEPIVPGRMRQAGDREVAVGRHLPPSSDRVAAFMEHFDKRFRIAERSASGRIIAIASAHHRLNFIHPFPDGNGRVSRLMSHAMALNAGIGGNGLWSISRGLARGLEDRGEYKQMMDHADTPRRGDRDGRGNLSQAALQTFCTWFLHVALDQVTFSAKLFDLGGLEKRYRRLVADTIDDKRAPDLMSAVLRHGTLDRGDAQIVLKTSERTARNTLKLLTSAGFLTSSGPKTPVRLAFPLDYRERLFPNLFAEADVL